MAKEPANPAAEERSDEYENFEQTVRGLLAVPKSAINEARAREQVERQNGNSSE